MKFNLLESYSACSRKKVPSFSLTVDRLTEKRRQKYEEKSPRRKNRQVSPSKMTDDFVIHNPQSTHHILDKFVTNEGSTALEDIFVIRSSKSKGTRVP